MKILLQRLCYVTLLTISFIPIKAQSANPPICIGIGKALQFDGKSFKCANSNVVHKIGENYGGGKVFYVTGGGIHGLVAANQDQSIGGVTWYDAQNAISNVANHNVAGQAFTDWRLPTKNELNLLYQQRFVVGGFADTGYWSATEAEGPFVDRFAWAQGFGNGGQSAPLQHNSFNVRAVRSF